MPEEERYIIRFSRPGSTEDEQIEVDGFAIWRKDAGFRSEHLLIDEGKELEAAWFGPWRVYADEKGITSVARLSTETDPSSGTLDKMIEILRHFDLQREADRVQGAKSSPLHEMLYELTRIERIPGLDTQVWHAVVLCKAALTGRDPEDKFTQQYNEIIETRKEQQ